MSSPPAETGSREARSRASRTPEIHLDHVLRDLATLLGSDQAVYLQLGPEAAIMSIKGRETFAFGESIGARWHGMTPPERARALLAWMGKAAEYCRKPRHRWLPA